MTYFFHAIGGYHHSGHLSTNCFSCKCGIGYEVDKCWASKTKVHIKIVCARSEGYPT